MLQTAQLLKEEQYLTIAENDTANTNVGASEVEFSSKSITINLFKKVSTFYYRSRIRLSFSVADEHKVEFVMIRGLIEFNRSKDFTFTYYLKNHTIETDIDASHLDKLQIFLSNVSILLEQENQFKLVLKEAIAFENRYKLEREGVYAILKTKATTLLTS
jgi:hypothetical protein